MGNPADRNQSTRTLWTLCSVPFIMVLGNSMIIPVLPQIREALGISLFQAGLLITAFSAPASVVILFAGYLADRFGRKVVMVPALLIYGLGGILAGLAAMLLQRSFPFILGARILQGAGAGGTYQIAMVLVSDLFTSQERSRALGLLEAWNGIGKVVSPVAGAGAAVLVWFAPFFAYGLLAIPIALGVWWLAREAPAEDASDSVGEYLGTLKDILRTKTVSFLVALLAGFTVLMLLFGVLSYAADIMETYYHIGVLRRGLLIAIPVLAMAITSYVSGTLLQNQMSRLLKPIVAAGCGLFAVSLATAAVLLSPGASLVAMFWMGVATGATLPALNTLITSSSPHETRGLTTAFYGTVRFVGVAFGPPAFGLLAPGGRPLVLALAASVAVVTALLSAAFIDPRRMVPEEILQPSGTAR